MFTGLIEQVGEIARWEQRGASRRLTIAHMPWEDGEWRCGDSVAINGACLTAEAVEVDHFVCSVLNETIERTSLAEKGQGAGVNLERAMSATARFGGHMVQGHVDGVGRVGDLRRRDGDRILRITGEESLVSGVVEKGSVALDGISLTVVDVGTDWFDVHIIPHTWDHTTLRDLAIGSRINIETDIIGKYVRRILGSTSHSELTEARLRAAGTWLA